MRSKVSINNITNVITSKGILVINRVQFKNRETGSKGLHLINVEIPFPELWYPGHIEKITMGSWKTP